MTSDMTPVIDKLTKVGSDPPVWLVDIGGKRLELSTEQLQNYQKFQRACLAKLNRVFGSVRQRDWLTTLADAMDKLQHETPDDKPPRDTIFLKQLEGFLTDCSDRKTDRSDRKEALLEGRPFESVKHGRCYFTIKSLEKYLKQQGHDPDRGKLYDSISSMGGGRHFFNVDDHRGIHVWFVPSSAVSISKPSATPAAEEDSI